MLEKMVKIGVSSAVLLRSVWKLMVVPQLTAVFLLRKSSRKSSIHQKNDKSIVVTRMDESPSFLCNFSGHTTSTRCNAKFSSASRAQLALLGTTYSQRITVNFSQNSLQSEQSTPVITVNSCRNSKLQSTVSQPLAHT